MLNIYYIVLLGLGIIGLIIYFLIAIRDFNKTGYRKFNFLTYIPFELNLFKVNKYNTFASQLIFLISTSFFPLSTFLFAFRTQQAGGSIGPAYSIFAVSTIVWLLVNVLIFLKLSHYNAHMIITSAFVVSNLLLDILSMFFFTTSYFKFVNGFLTQPLQITCFIISLILILFEMLLMLNPSYKDWFKMVKVDAETFNRPKHCYLAMLEWGSLLHYILFSIIITILMFL